MSEEQAQHKRGFARGVYKLLLLISVILGFVYVLAILTIIGEVISDTRYIPTLLVMTVATIAHIAIHIYAERFAISEPTLGKSIVMLCVSVLGAPFVLFGGCIMMIGVTGLNLN